jgi:hypothetical protein
MGRLRALGYAVGVALVAFTYLALPESARRTRPLPGEAWKI